MKRTISFLATLSIILSLSSCTALKVSETNEKGYFNSVKQAKTIKAENIDLDTRKSLILVPSGADNFFTGMVNNIKYFDQVVTFSDLEKEIIKNGKIEEIGNIEGKVGLHNIAKKYRNFVYLIFYKPNEKKIQLKLVDPETTDDLFIAETAYDIVWAGVNDANTFYPLFNEFIKYIEKNSKTYKK